jgi:ADP-heptose:LPS heptosyltransferase
MHLSADDPFCFYFFCALNIAEGTLFAFTPRALNGTASRRGPVPRAAVEAMGTACRIETLVGHSPRRIVIFRALVIGDMLCAVPALRALRQAYPTAEVTLVSLPWASEFARRFAHYIDHFVEFPGYPGLPERDVDVAAIPAFFKHLQEEKFDLALQMHGSGSYVNPLVELMGARVTAGFTTPSDYAFGRETFLLYPEDVPEPQRHLRLLEHLSVPSAGDHLELPVFDEDFTALAALPVWRELQSQPYACLHPGARFLSRRWKPEGFAAVGNSLHQMGLRVVVTGTRAEADVVAEVTERMQAPAINLAGQTSLGMLAALLTNSRLLISNDTGVSHVAAALRVPSVVVVCGSDPTRWAPLDRDRHLTVMGEISCRPCEHVVCPIGFPCAERVTAEDVVARATQLLSSSLMPMNRVA